MIASALSRTIFEIKATGEKTNISTPMLSGSGKNTLSFVSLDASAFPKISGCWFAAYSSTNVSGSLNLDHQRGEVNLRQFLKSRHSMLVVSEW